MKLGLLKMMQLTEEFMSHGTLFADTLTHRRRVTTMQSKRLIDFGHKRTAVTLLKKLFYVLYVYSFRNILDKAITRESIIQKIKHRINQLVSNPIFQRALVIQCDDC